MFLEFFPIFLSINFCKLEGLNVYMRSELGRKNLISLIQLGLDWLLFFIASC